MHKITIYHVICRYITPSLLVAILGFLIYSQTCECVTLKPKCKIKAIYVND